MELHGGAQQLCPLMLPSLLDGAMQCELTCPKAAVSELGEVLLEGYSLGV